MTMNPLKIPQDRRLWRMSSLLRTQESIFARNVTIEAAQHELGLANAAFVEAVHAHRIASLNHAVSNSDATRTARQEALDRREAARERMMRAHNLTRRVMGGCGV